MNGKNNQQRHVDLKRGSFSMNCTIRKIRVKLVTND